MVHYTLLALACAILAGSLSVAVPIDERQQAIPGLEGLLGVIPGKRKLTFNSDGTFKVCSLPPFPLPLVPPGPFFPPALLLPCLLDSRGLEAGEGWLNVKVVSFSDMHFGERWGNGSFASWGPENDANTQRVHGVVLDNEQPDYVVFNGDIMTGENVFADNATGYLDQCFAPTVQRGIPFSSTHGNHDNANNINHNEEIQYEQQHYGWDLSYTRSDTGPKPYGDGNYWVPVYASQWDWAPALIMWFFDSRSFVSGTGNGPGPVPDAANYYWVDEDTVPGYIKQQSGLMQKLWGEVPPSLVFVHIPFQHSDPMSTLPSEGDHDDEPNPAVQGYLGNDYTGLDLPTFSEIVALSQGKNKVLAVTSGHDHGESWCARSTISQGISLCFDGHSGYGGYVTPHSVVRNGRVFNVKLSDIKQEYPTVDTWNSYENSTIDDVVTLGRNYMPEYN